MSEIPFSVQPKCCNESGGSGDGVTQEELDEALTLYTPLTSFNQALTDFGAALDDKEVILTFDNNIITPFESGKIERSGSTITYTVPDLSPYLTIASASSTYQPIQPSKVHLSAYKTANTDGLANFQYADVVGYTTQIESNAGSFNTTTGVFVAPRAGIYRIEGNIAINDVIPSPYLITVDTYISRKVGAGSFIIEATSYFDNEVGNFNTIVQGITMKPTCMLNLAVGDEIKLSAQVRTGNNTWSIAHNLGTFLRATTLNIYTID